ncbi:hypothetical protein AC331_19660 [Salmonella enterica subsp. enterica]|uniref:hypothetical protein n=1 Tax=Salmonella enterica TaxID=28901 RepID=UPI00076BA8C9|nr:hypothetical protein [Salmonella enterica]EAW1595208.1 hypothetical protein [Salmonella enterica subsp. enterica]EBW5403423.1 hypothetical protein [Salmonella enterica subsp. enterica serovar Southampton]EDR9147872.1 hypothetical protein [Salmonella enterica subsp. enterica serovar Agbeni]EEP8537291.1 hypothetical protein [Salmonella enterica subsp. enterica serovar Zega]EAQ5909493.1 hypothetical protein [Salmonella enterica]
MKLTRRELEIVNAITMQHRMKHTGVGKRDVMAVFHRARAAVLEARVDKGEAATIAPSFTWRKPVAYRR